MPIIIVDATMNPGEQRNMLASMMVAFAGFCPFLSTRLITTISTIRTTNTKVIRFIKGRSGNAPLVHTGRNFSTVESGIVRIADVRAAFAVAFFQKKPNRKIERTPGEMKPTYSCTN